MVVIPLFAAVRFPHTRTHSHKDAYNGMNIIPMGNNSKVSLIESNGWKAEATTAAVTTIIQRTKHDEIRHSQIYEMGTLPMPYWVLGIVSVNMHKYRTKVLK